MSIIDGLLRKLGMRDSTLTRPPLRVFLLDDDRMRHEWFAKRFQRDDTLDVAETPAQAVELLEAHHYDLIFLDHDLLPEHYHAQTFDDEKTGYAVATWLASHPERQPAASILVHTRNADGAMRMVDKLRRAGRPAEYVSFPLLSPFIKNRWQR